MKDIYPLLFPASFFLLLAIERFLPGRAQPKIRFWALKGAVFFLIGGVINSIVPEVLGGLVAGHTLLDLSGLGLGAGAVVGLLAATFVDYWTHRFMHRVHAVWRWSHQLHHSAERVDMAGFAYTHPFELVLATTTTPIVSLAIGVSPGAAMLAGFLSFAIGLFCHLNVRTARWIGYIIQRPEQHQVHHTRGVHAYNYGLPLWDLAFGTFRNPAACTEQAGFWDGASKQTFAMLVGRDVAVPPHVSAVADAVSQRLAA
jgi:sterol desaturase/sphingolipid hydroxylase (fatty acid hydroxylase superfamily)